MKTTHHPAYIEMLGRLVAIRKGLGWTQADLGNVLSRPQSYVAKIECGNQRVDLVEFYHWLVALRLDPAAIVTNLFDLLGSTPPTKRRGLIKRPEVRPARVELKKKKRK